MKLTFAQCSGCKAQTATINGYGPAVERRVRQMAELVGWEFRSDGDFCPDCRVRNWKGWGDLKS